jgi:hypothetical protein
MGHYLGNHDIALKASAYRAVNALNSMRPNPQKQGPLDPEPKADAVAQAKYNRALMIGNQPLTILHLLKSGQMTNQDVSILNAVHPGAAESMSQKIINEIIQKNAAGEHVPYGLQAGVSRLTGQPMSGSFVPARIQSNQTTFQQAHQNSAQKQQPKKVNQGGMNKMQISSRFSLKANDEG